MDATGYSRRQLYELFMQFKALCAMSPDTVGIDRETFRRGIPMLVAEDDAFVERVYDLLDEDGSRTIEWDEFITAMAKLDKGTRRHRASFLFDIYNADGDSSLDTDELLEMLLNSLYIKEEDASPQLLAFLKEMTTKILSDVDPDHSGELERSKILEYIDAHPELEDIAKVFGRAMIPTSGFTEVQRLMRKADGRRRIREFTRDVRKPEFSAGSSLFDKRAASFRFGKHITQVARERLLRSSQPSIRRAAGSPSSSVPKKNSPLATSGGRSQNKFSGSFRAIASPLQRLSRKGSKKPVADPRVQTANRFLSKFHSLGSSASVHDLLAKESEEEGGLMDAMESFSSLHHPQRSSQHDLQSLGSSKPDTLTGQQSLSSSMSSSLSSPSPNPRRPMPLRISSEIDALADVILEGDEEGTPYTDSVASDSPVHS